MNQATQDVIPMGGTWKGDTSPAVIAMVYGHAAAIITRHGYSGLVKSHVPGERVSLVTALEMAAREVFAAHEDTIGTYLMDAARLGEEATERLGGLLVMTGQAGHSAVLPSVVDNWDSDYDQHDQAAALHILAVAAYFTTVLAGTVA